jgi:hypothetical protein
VAGYSRLIGVDEGGTLERLKALRRELLDPKIAEHGGRLVKTTGDGLLVEFASVVDAVHCAVAVQQAMLERNTGAAADNRIELRIGINLGDVIVEGDDLYGDGRHYPLGRAERSAFSQPRASGAVPPGHALGDGRAKRVTTFLLPKMRSSCARDGSRIQAVAGAAGL